jgi:hypothetical protein
MTSTITNVHRIEQCPNVNCTVDHPHTHEDLTSHIQPVDIPLMTICRFKGVHEFAVGINCWQVSAIQPPTTVTTGTEVFIERYGMVKLIRKGTIANGWVAFVAESEGIIEAVVVIRKECAGQSWAEMVRESVAMMVPSCFYST